METLLKSKGLWQYTKVTILDALEKISIDGKKDGVVGVITNYISWEIYFHLSGIDCMHQSTLYLSVVTIYLYATFVLRNFLSLFDCLQC